MHRHPQSHDGKRTFGSASTTAVAMVAVVLAGAVLLLTAGGRTLGVDALWTFHHLIHVPLWLRIGMATLLVGAVFLPVAPVMQTWADRLPRASPWLLIPLAGVFFWTLRERTLWGDGLFKSALLSTESLRTDPYVWKEPLDALLAYNTVDLVARWGWDATDGVALLSIAAGMVYVTAALWIARLLSAQKSGAAIIFGGLIALGSSQLWFGHVENYSLVTAVAYLTVALALAYRQQRAPLWAVGLAGGAAVSFHPQAIFVLPPLLLLLERRRWLRQIGVLLATGAIVPVFTVTALLLAGAPLPSADGGFAGDPQLFWTLPQALAPRQLWDGLMNLWLLVPALPVLAPLVLWAWTRPALRRDWTFRFLSLLALSLLVYHFGFQNDLPRPQDWDLFAIVGPGVALVGWHVASSRWQVAGSRWQVGSGRASVVEQSTHHTPGTTHSAFRILHSALLFSLLFTAAWLGVNRSYTLLAPDPHWRVLYERYRLLDLKEALAQATVDVPDEPLCLEPRDDPSGCQRVALSEFTMPQDGDQRDVIFAHAPARIVFPLDLPDERTFLWLSPALDPVAWDWGGDGVTFRVLVKRGESETLLAERHLTPQNPGDRRWTELFVPLAEYWGESLQLILETMPGPAGDAAGDRAGWGIAWLMAGTVRE